VERRNSFPRYPSDNLNIPTPEAQLFKLLPLMRNVVVIVLMVGWLVGWLVG